jgi:hypothetical protein
MTRKHTFIHSIYVYIYIYKRRPHHTSTIVGKRKKRGKNDAICIDRVDLIILQLMVVLVADDDELLESKKKERKGMNHIIFLSSLAVDEKKQQAE